jgi:hypothetical protein
MANGDFRFRPTLNVAGIADLLASRKIREEQIKQGKVQQKLSTLGTLMQAVQLGSNLATQGLARSQVRQELDARSAMTDILARGSQPAPGPVTTQATVFDRPPAGAEGPVFQRQIPITPSVPFRETPEFRQELLSTFPGAPGGPQIVAQEAFRREDPLRARLTESQIRKNVAAAKKARQGSRVPSKEQLAPEPVVVDAFAKSLKTSNENVAKLQEQGLLPKRLTFNQVQSLKGESLIDALLRQGLVGGNVGFEAGGGGTDPNATVDNLLGIE